MSVRSSVGWLRRVEDSCAGMGGSAQRHTLLKGRKIKTKDHGRYGGDDADDDCDAPYIFFIFVFITPQLISPFASLPPRWWRKGGMRTTKKNDRIIYFNSICTKTFRSILFTFLDEELCVVSNDSG